MSERIVERPAVRRRTRRVGAVGAVVGLALVAWFGFSFAGTPWLAAGPAAIAVVIMGWLWVSSLASLRSEPRPLAATVIITVVLAGTVGGAAVHLPTKARFALSAESFTRVVERAGPPVIVTNDTGEFPIACPSRIGSYAIEQCAAVDDGYLFFDSLGNALADYAGFAYLPNGPDLRSNAGYELQELIHLHGDWYAFAASW